jgi:hypothetical protein
MAIMILARNSGETGLIVTILVALRVFGSGAIRDKA